jgi:hypothetical protein
VEARNSANSRARRGECSVRQDFGHLLLEPETVGLVHDRGLGAGQVEGVGRRMEQDGDRG